MNDPATSTRERIGVLARDIVASLLFVALLIGQIVAWNALSAYAGANASSELSQEDAARATSYVLRISGTIWGFIGIGLGLLGVALAAQPPRRMLLLWPFVAEITTAILIMIAWVSRAN